MYAIAPMEFPHHKEKIIGYLEMAAGLGLTLGPFLSGIVYTYLHYAGTFFFFAFILFSTGCFLHLFLPSKMNGLNYGIANEGEDSDDEENK